MRRRAQYIFRSYPNIGDQVSPTPETAICAGQVADNIKGYVFQTKEILTNSYGTLDLQWTQNDILPKRAAYTALVNLQWRPSVNTRFRI